MITFNNALIGIQARSTSTRFPDKVSHMLDGKPMLDHVINSCYSALKYINRNSQKTGIVGNIALFIPEGDPLKDKYKNRMDIVEGPEDDVLTRYYEGAKTLKADYLVRVTGDCPLLPPYLISKVITILVKGKHSLVSNCAPETRTSIDGFDVEAMTMRALKWAHESATSQQHREHVTQILYNPEFTPEWLSVACLVGFVDLSAVHLSVDTEADLERVEKMIQKFQSKIKKSEDLYGRGSIYRF